MNIITRNPFRILGLTSNSSERELQKRISIIKKFASIGKIKEFDFDFSFLGDLQRTADTVQKASSQIEQMHKKVHNALFWFTNSNRIDETALNYLKDNNIEKAIEIWDKTIKDNINEKNYSSYANLSTLLIGISSVNGSINKELLRKGIALKGKLLNSENLQTFVSEITGNGNISNIDKLNFEFTDEISQLVKPYLNKKELTQREYVRYFSSFPVQIQKSVTAKFSETHIFHIENEIEKTIEKRNAIPKDAAEYGEELYKSTKKDIVELINILGKDNVQFQMIANKLANELLQCSIDFYNIHREEDSDFDPGDDALQLIKYARAVGASGHVSERINESLETIKEWVDDKEEREKHQIIKEELKFITNQLERFQNLSISVKNAEELTNSCRPKLNIIKKELGTFNDFYLQLSSSVVQNAQAMIVQKINEQQKVIPLIEPSKKFIAIALLKGEVENALKATKMLGNFDMLPELRVHYNKNLAALKSIANQLGISTSQTNTNNNTSEFDFAKNAWWIIALIIGTISGIGNESWGAFFMSTIGTAILITLFKFIRNNN